MRFAAKATVVAVALISLVAPSAAATPDVDAALRDKVRAAALVTYVHGMTDELAAKEIGPEGVPALLELLADPAFPRRDNVVAFLAHLPSGRSVPRLLAQLEKPVADVHRTVEDRAMLLIPHALGWLAKSGDEAALDALLAMTAPNGRGGVLGRAVAASRYGEEQRRDLVREAVRALAIVDRKEARARLDRLASGRHAPNVPGLDVADAARRARDSRSGRAAPLSTSQSSDPGMLVADPSPLAHDSTLTYANHADIAGDPALGMSDDDVDAAFRIADGIAARPDIPDDVSCCHRLRRGGPGAVFGLPGDGWDVVSDPDEMERILDLPVARVKVVRAINWCGAPATNIIGCSWFPGNGMTVVKLGDGNDGVLWLHEYGHNVGLEHVGDPRYVMYPYLQWGDFALRVKDCAALHAPPPEAAATVVESGACVDDDGDGVPWTGDNCPGLANPNQSDLDGDARGFECDNCWGVANYDQIDTDGDGRGDACDVCPTIPDSQADLDHDGHGDVCDVCPSDPDDDADADAYCANLDNCPWLPNADQADEDGDGRGNVCDRCPGDPANDPDADGICASVDQCPQTSVPVEPDWSYSGPYWDSAATASAVGDVNGDGFDDVAVIRPAESVRGAPYDLGRAGVIRIFAGSAAGLSERPAWILRGERAGQEFGRAFEPAGDVNGDDFEDVLIASSFYELGFYGGAVELFLGSRSGPRPTPVWHVSRLDHPAFGLSLAAGDVNCDGLQDLVVADPYDYDFTTLRQGRVEIYFGRASGFASVPDVTLVPDAQGRGEFGASLAAAIDFDGDGCGDLAVGSPGLEPGRVRIYFGPVRGWTTQASVVVTGPGQADRFGESIAALGDLNQDGTDELGVGAPGYRPGLSSGPTGAIFIQPGNSTREANGWSRILPTDAGVENFGSTVASAGDADRDGHADVAAAAKRFVFVLRGVAGGVADIPLWTHGTDSDRIAAAGDVDGDGFADVVTYPIQTPSCSACDVALHRGGPDGPASARQRDSDGDGVPDACDSDRDGDGLPNSWDLCPSNFDPSQADADGDGIGDACDGCPAAVDPDQTDFDEDGIGDACDADAEGDGVDDVIDNCPRLPNASQADADGDGVGSACDDCPFTPNPGQEDADHDTVGDVCDPDLDGDGRLNGADNCTALFNPDQLDLDEDHVGDACDPCIDRDGDGYADGLHDRSKCPGVPYLADCDDGDASRYPGAFDACDGKDNDCNGLADDALCSDFVLASYERVDGITLAELGRAFGLCSATPASEWWSRVEYSGDRCVDGADLAVLSAVWACTGDTPICPH